MNAVWTIYFRTSDGARRVYPIVFKRADIQSMIYLVEKVLLDECEDGWIFEDLSIAIDHGGEDERSTV